MLLSGVRTLIFSPVVRKSGAEALKPHPAHRGRPPKSVAWVGSKQRKWLAALGGPLETGAIGVAARREDHPRADTVARVCVLRTTALLFDTRESH